jgi:hypothetical protein
MEHTPESLRPQLERLRRHLDQADRDPATLPVTVAGVAHSREDLAAWEALGVDRLILTPWERASTAPEQMGWLAARLELAARQP